MADQKENFLDRSTIIAIVLVGFCWIGWDSYMKKKYPDYRKKAQQEKGLKADQKEISKQEFVASLPANLKARPTLNSTKKEKIHTHSSKKLNLQISSKGLGVKNLTIKDFLDRKGEPIVFKGGETALFATKILNEDQPIDFKVTKKKKGLYEGIYSNKKFSIKKTLELDEEKLLLKIKTKVVQHKKNSVPGLSLHFSTPIPLKEKSNAFMNMMSFYTKDLFEAFVLFEKGKEFLLEKDLEQEQSFSLVSFAGTGGKYFGKAFVNKSSLLPSLNLKSQQTVVTSRLEYKFLHSKVNVLEYEIFYGPKSISRLRSLNKKAEQWINFGIFSFLAKPMLSILIFFHKILFNWGLAIIALTFFVRLCLLPLNVKSYKSMKVMQKIQPKMQEIRKQYKDKPQEMNQKVLALMRESKANPFGSFLPMLLQFPVFFALYRVLGQSIELYQSPFAFWISDLSLKDPYFILPVLAGATFFVQQKITPMNMPPAQARVLTFMPVIFSVFMIGLPSGLTLYIFISGLFGLVQQFWFTKLKDN